MSIHSILESIKCMPRNIEDGVRNLVRWFPVIWQDRDWDHHYFYIILDRKLKNMEEFFTSDRAMALHGEKEAEKIRTCLILLNRLMEDNYDESAFKKHREKWGRPKFGWDDGNFEITYKNVITNEDKKNERKLFSEACIKETQMRKQDVNYLFDYIGKHVECWWD